VLLGDGLLIYRRFNWRINFYLRNIQHFLKESTLGFYLIKINNFDIVGISELILYFYNVIESVINQISFLNEKFLYSHI